MKMKVKKLDFKKTEKGWEFVEEIIDHPFPDVASQEYGYLFVDIDTTLDELLEKIKQINVSVIFKIRHISHSYPYLKYKDLPLHDEMRDELKEDECWDELQKLDHDGELPSLRYKKDSALINEIIDAVKTGHLALDKTEIRFLKENKSEYYSGTGNKIKLVLKYIGSQ